MSDVFICHAEEDTDVVLEIARNLEAVGYSVWYYERDSFIGVDYLDQVDREIAGCQAVVVVLSAVSLSSQEVEDEVKWARKYGKPRLPIMKGISWDEFQNRTRWRMALGIKAGLVIPNDGVGAIAPRVIRGLEEVAVKPTGPAKAAAAVAGTGTVTWPGPARNTTAGPAPNLTGLSVRPAPPQLPLRGTVENNKNLRPRDASSTRQIDVSSASSLTPERSATGERTSATPDRVESERFSLLLGKFRQQSLRIAVTFAVALFVVLAGSYIARMRFASGGQLPDSRQGIQQPDTTTANGDPVEIAPPDPVATLPHREGRDQKARSSVPTGSGLKDGGMPAERNVDALHIPPLTLPQQAPITPTTDDSPLADGPGKTNPDEENQPVKVAPNGPSGTQLVQQTQPSSALVPGGATKGNSPSQIQPSPIAPVPPPVPEPTNLASNSNIANIVAASAPESVSNAIASRGPVDSPDRQAITASIQKLSAAFSHRSMAEVLEIWPRIGAIRNTLKTIFDTAQSLSRDFHIQSLSIANDGATATVIGTYDGKLRDGRGVETTSSGNFYVRLGKRNDKWLIDDASF
jgi:hypothetical protein